MIKSFQALSLAFLLTACLPVMKSEYYISFEHVDNIEILRVSKKVSVEYQLKQAIYMIALALDDKSGLRLFVSAKDNADNPLNIEVEVKRRGLKEKHCSSFGLPYPQDKISETEGVLAVNWYIFRSGCGLDEIKDQALTLHIIIMDKHGQIIGEDELPFVIEKKGVRIIYDAI